MEKTNAVTALAALAQDSRLAVFRLLVRAGPEGLPAGAVADALDLAPNTLTFHFDRLRMAGLVTVRREGRSILYSVDFSAMSDLLVFLTEDCCGGRSEICAPLAAAASRCCQPPKRAPRASRATASARRH